MNFGEKLNILMSITNTSAQDLSKATSIDTAYINKLLCQTNVPIKSKKNISEIISYFTQKIDSHYKITAICDVFSINPSTFPDTKEKMINILSDILCLSESNQLKKNQPQLNKELFDSQYLSDAKIIDVACFHGLKGRQNAYILFLNLILKSEKTNTVYLSSDDDILWLLENPKLTKHILELTTKVLAKGNKIIIIHDVKQTFYDMLHTVEMWFPLYASGLVIPYCYQNKKDALIGRTLFLAPDVAGIVSTSTGDNFENKTDFFIKDKSILCGFVKEFNYYLSLCKPLLKVFTNHTILDFHKLVDETDFIDEDFILKPITLSRLTIPDELMKKILNRQLSDKDEANLIFNYCSIKHKLFLNSLDKNTTYDIITLPDIKTVLEKKVKFPSHNPLNNEHIYYTPQEYIEHLENMIFLLKNYKNYHVNIQKQNILPDCSIFIRKNVGMIFIKKSEKDPFIFTISEPSFTDSFWDYMYINANPFEDSDIKRKKAISKIKSFIKKIKQQL